MSPDICAVVRNIDRDVAHETDAALPAINLELLPLLEEFELPKLVSVHFRHQSPRPLAQGMRVSIPNLCVQEVQIVPWCSSLQAMKSA